MSEFEPTGDLLVDVNRLQARAVMRLSKVKPQSERQQEHLQDAINYLKEAGELMAEWENTQLDAIADDAAIAQIVERHVERILHQRTVDTA